MKIIFLSFFTTLFFLSAFGQENFQWEKIDSVQKSKAQIYSDTKMFIAENWKSAQNVIQNDDKDGGLILVKGSVKKDYTFMLRYNAFIFNYTVKFFMKEEKYKIQIEDLYCQSATSEGYDLQLMPVRDIYPSDLKYPGVIGLNKERYEEVMASLKRDLQKIVNDYEIYIKAPSTSNGDW